MNTIRFALVIFVAGGSLSAAETVALTDLDLTHLHVAGWGAPRVDRSFSGKPLTVAGHAYERGIGTRATTTLWLELDGRVDNFSATVGVDDAAGASAALRVSVIGDGQKLWISRELHHGEPAAHVDVPLRGIHSLLLSIDHIGDPNPQNHADWIEPRLIYSGARPVTVNAPREDAVVLTPKPLPAPRINGPKVYGCRPGHPFVYRIPTTGERPMEFSAMRLPPGLQLDAVNGIITGEAPERGTHTVILNAKNQHGAYTRILNIVSGDTLALTPPMGWNHWYAHYTRITDAMMRQAADVMVRSGMADAGYAYVNIDDCWEHAPVDAKRKHDPARVGPLRDAAGNLIPNRYFPDMRALVNYIHGYGLKAGIYSSPGPLTCGGFAGSYEHEEQDVQQFVAWGFDFLKYDWCSYRQIAKNDQSLPALQAPYRKMGDILRRAPRDVVFNLCQYGMGDVWTWGAEVGGTSWRTANDLGGELNRIFPVALKNAQHREWSKPGAWNDPDYVQIGYVGLARGGGEPAPCPLTPTEQYSFMSLWSLMASPLFFSGDLSRLDEFTLNVLCNPEVIEIDQDPLGESARVLPRDSGTFVMVKRLDDGSRAIGLCNGDDITHEVAVAWRDLELSGGQRVRDVWRQRDLGDFADRFSAKVSRHGVVLLRVAPLEAPHSSPSQ